MAAESAFPQLLDLTRLNGAYPVRRFFGPPFRAHFVSDYDDAVAAVHETCHYWGGAIDLLLPFRAGGLEPRWRELAAAAALDGLETRDKATDEEAEALLGRKVGRSVGDFLLSVLAFSGTKRDEWREVEVALPAADDPWYLAYLTALGAWPERPNKQFVDWARLDPDLEWSRVIPVSFSTVSVPGPDDLLRRLRRYESQTPAGVTVTFLGLSQAPRDQGVGEGATRIPRRRPDLAMIGPNVVIVYEPGSIDDLCLVWSLRGAHALNEGLPLAVPASADLDEVLAVFEREHAGVYFGLGGERRRWALTSLSVPLEQLAKVADRRSGRWQIRSADELLQAPRRPGLASSTFATFVDGEARVDAWGEEDARLFGRWPQGVLYLQAVVNLRLESRRLPPSRTLAGRFPYDGYFHDGGWHLLARTPPNTRPMRWPSGWTVIQALARDQGLRASPSTAGAAAATLLRQLGSLEAVSAILNPSVVTELHGLGERRGMSWFRRRARKLAADAGANEARLAAIERRLDDLSLRAFEGEGNALTVESVRELLGQRHRASAWLRWALERGLLVQGVEVECRRCGAQSWRSVQEIAPPVVCRGCGATIERPFPVDQLKFRYRASESFLRVVEADAMSHILTLRWWCELFADPFNKGSYLYGAYPGVDLKNPDGATVGEADVLLVLADGAIVPGECKRTSAGLNEVELGKLDGLADALGSPWTFVATLSPSRDCDAIWKQAAEADGGTRPRLVLTADQLYEVSVVPALGEDAFGWRERTPNDDARRDEAWKAQLGDRLEYLSEERDPDAYLFKEFDEEDE